MYQGMPTILEEREYPSNNPVFRASYKKVYN